MGWNHQLVMFGTCSFWTFHGRMYFAYSNSLRRPMTFPWFANSYYEGWRNSVTTSPGKLVCFHPAAVVCFLKEPPQQRVERSSEEQRPSCDDHLEIPRFLCFGIFPKLLFTSITLGNSPNLICFKKKQLHKHLFQWNMYKKKSYRSCWPLTILGKKNITPPKFNSSPLKNGGTGRQAFRIGFR